MIHELPVGPNDLNHPKVKPLMRALAGRLGFEERFTDFLFAESRPSCFDYRVAPPDRGWTCLIPDEYDAGYPLWSTNANQTLVCVAGEEQYFVQGYHDEPVVTVVARTPQGLLADLFIDLWEDDESLTEIEGAAGICGFRFLERVLEFCESDKRKDYDGERRRLISSIDRDSRST